MYVYKTQFCSPECYGRYLEVKEAQRAAKEAPATAGTAEIAPERTEPQIPKGSRNRKKAAEEPAERPSEALS